MFEFRRSGGISVCPNTWDIPPLLPMQPQRMQHFDWKTLRFKERKQASPIVFVYIRDFATYQLHPTTLFSIPSLYQHQPSKTIPSCLALLRVFRNSAGRRAFEVVIFALVLASLFWVPRWPGVLHTLKRAAKPPRDEDDDSHSGYNLETRFEWIVNAFDSWILDDDWSF